MKTEFWVDLPNPVFYSQIRWGCETTPQLLWRAKLPHFVRGLPIPCPCIPECPLQILTCTNSTCFRSYWKRMDRKTGDRRLDEGRYEPTCSYIGGRRSKQLYMPFSHVSLQAPLHYVCGLLSLLTPLPCSILWNGWTEFLLPRVSQGSWGDGFTSLQSSNSLGQACVEALALLI